MSRRRAVRSLLWHAAAACGSLTVLAAAAAAALERAVTR